MGAKSQNKRILFIINNLSTGGAEGVFLNDINTLHERGFDCYLAILYPDKSNLEMLDKLKISIDNIWKIGFKNLYDIWSYVKLIKKIHKSKITIAYSTLDEANFVAKISCLFAKTKLFCREANMTYDKPLKFKISDIILNFFVYRLVMVARAVLTSYASYDPLHRHKMTVLYNGVNIPINFRKEKVGNGPVKIIAVGSFTPKKGLDDLITIVSKKIYPKNKNFKLEIVGSGVLFDKIQSEIKQYGLEDNVKCLGAMNKEELAKRYLDSDIFVLTSKKEGCPNVLLEAMSYGLAPICFSVGAVPEIIEDGISGNVIHNRDMECFAEAALSLIENRKKISQIGAKARQRIIDKFSFQTHYENLLQTLEL